MPNILNRNGVPFINLKSNYLVSLINTCIGLHEEAKMNKDDVISVKSPYPSDTDYCYADIYCRAEQKILPIIITANDRFRYTYKNEVKNACRP